MDQKYERNTIISFQGPININVLSFFGNYIKVLLKEEFKTVTKIFKIFIELTQNISYYSAENTEINDNSTVGVGEFELKEYDEYYLFSTGNLVYKNDGEKLVNHCTEINKLDLDQLRILKREKRNQSESMDVGAHIGLIQVGLLSLSPYEFNVTKLDDNYSYFTIKVKIDK